MVAMKVSFSLLMLKVLTVKRYRSSGKLVASGLGTGYVLPLNGDLTFSQKAPHKLQGNTLLDLTPYRIEVEIGKEGKHDTVRVVRRWNEDDLPPRSTDPFSPLEEKIDVSPSEYFTDAEKAYVGQSAGHAVGFTLAVSSFFLIWLVGLLGWWIPILAFTVGAFIVYMTSTPGDPSKIQEVKDAKTRVRAQAERKLKEALLNVHEWAALDGVGFEQAVARIYRDKGFDVQFTPRTNDQGIDLILRKDGNLSIVQCKAYNANVGVSAVRELAGVRGAWPNANDVILATLFDFSKAAKAFAAQQNIKLFSIARDYLRTDYRPDR
jgi:HJR/Mrr/RecB family endonuclease